MKPFEGLALLAALSAISFTAQADIAKHLASGQGSVRYQIGDEWAVISEQANRPISTVMYQIPNPADADTAESTNIVLVLYDLTTAKGRSGYETPLPHYSAQEPTESTIEGWSVHKHTGVQNDVEYTILDARNDNVADLAATVRLAWPHLPDNDQGYDQRMIETFRGFLAGVQGEVAIPTPDVKSD
jgi:hypothetical protein